MTLQEFREKRTSEKYIYFIIPEQSSSEWNFNFPFDETIFFSRKDKETSVLGKCKIRQGYSSAIYYPHNYLRGILLKLNCLGLLHFPSIVNNFIFIFNYFRMENVKKLRKKWWQYSDNAAIQDNLILVESPS